MKRREFIAGFAGAALMRPLAARAQQPAMLVIGFVSEASTQPLAASEIAPQGKLRVGMLGYNPVLVTHKPDGNIGGVSVNLGKFMAERLGVALEPVVYASPESGVQSYGKNEWDVVIGPRGPAAEQKADFGPDILLVDNIYVAAPGRDFVDAGQVDKPGVKIGVVQNAVPDQFLSRTLTFAELVRVSAPIEVAVETLRSGKADVFASSGQYARAVAASLPNATIVPGAFLTTHMAVALAKGRSPVAQSKLAEIINEAKRTGVMQKAIDDAGLTGCAKLIKSSHTHHEARLPQGVNRVESTPPPACPHDPGQRPSRQKLALD